MVPFWTRVSTRRLGHEWRFLKGAIQDWLRNAIPTWEARKLAILALAGKYKDDPDLEQIVEEALRRRGREMPESSSAKDRSG